MPRSRQTKNSIIGDRRALVLVVFLCSFVIVAMLPIYMLSHRLVNSDYKPDIRLSLLSWVRKKPDEGAGVVAEAQIKMSESSESPHAIRDIEPPIRELQFFPLVQELNILDSRCCAGLSLDTRIEVFGEGASSVVLKRAATRVEKMLQKLREEAVHATLSARSSLWLVRVIRVTTSSADEKLVYDSDAEYWLDCSELHRTDLGQCQIQANSVYGAVSALQSTLLQLFSDRGVAKFRSLKIHDWSRFKIRGLMVDTGRRFVPADILRHQVLDGMALTRMNVLHLHLSDFCRFAVDLPGFLELRQKGLLDGQYSIQEIQDVVNYARDRGVLVMPEIDIPGHANSLLPLKGRGLQFCESDRGTLDSTAKIFDDPDGKSRAVLRQLFEEISAAFGDASLFHMGADEASPIGGCTAENIASVEGFVTSDILGRDLKRTPVAWEELLYKQSVPISQKAVGSTNTIIMAWSQAKPEDVAARGHRVIAANSERHYLDYDFIKHPISNFWYEPVSLQRDKPQNRNCGQPIWEEHLGTFLGTYADSGGLRSLERAKLDCINSGEICVGITCIWEASESKCDTRKGEPFLQGSRLERSLVKLCPDEVHRVEHVQLQQEKKKAIVDKLVGGISAMWTDRYCYIFQCGAAQEWFGRDNGLIPGASQMFSREFDSSFALSLSGMIWPRAGVTSAAFWNYQSWLGEETLLKRAAWLATFLRKFDIMSCPARTDCDELSAGPEAYPVLRHGSSDDTSFLSFCFPSKLDSAAMALGAPLDAYFLSFSTSRLSLTASLRLCFWKGKFCGGVSCTTSPSTGQRECTLRSSGTDFAGTDIFVKRTECQGI